MPALSSPTRRRMNITSSLFQKWWNRLMCLACEQDAIWLQYLESQGLLKPDDPAAVEALFAGFPVQPLPLQSEVAVKVQNDKPPPTQPNPSFSDYPNTHSPT